MRERRMTYSILTLGKLFLLGLGDLGEGLLEGLLDCLLLLHVLLLSIGIHEDLEGE